MNMLQAARQLGTTWVYGRLYDDPFNQLLPRAGRTDPDPFHPRLRADAPVTRSRSGDWVVTGHGLANSVLRDRRFGVRNTPYDPGAASELGYTTGAEYHFSILEIDPPDHTGCASSPRPRSAPG